MKATLKQGGRRRGTSFAAALLACCTHASACAHPTFDNFFDVTSSDGIAILAAMLGEGWGAGQRLGYSWERIAGANPGVLYDSVAVVYRGRLWLYGGRNISGFPEPLGAVSDDGILFATPNLAPVLFDATVFGQPAAVEFNGAIFLAMHTIENNGDSRLRIFSSTDGINFTPRFNYLYAAANTIGEPALAVFRGRLFAYDFGLAFYSDDGGTWINAGATGVAVAGESQTNHGAAVFGNSIVREHANNLFVSFDGISFSPAIIGDVGSVFQEHLVFDNRLFTVVESGRVSSMFETRDLSTRTTISPLNTICCRMAPFTRREDYTAVVFRDRMRFYGGRSIDSLHVFGDAWFSLGGGSGRDGATHTDFSK